MAQTRELPCTARKLVGVSIEFVLLLRGHCRGILSRLGIVDVLLQSLLLYRFGNCLRSSYNLESLGREHSLMASKM